MKIQNGLEYPGTTGGRDWTLAVKSQEISKKPAFFVKNKNYQKKMLTSSRIMGEANFQPLEFPEVGQKQKTGGKKTERW